MKKSYFLFVILFFAFKVTFTAQTSSIGYPYDFEKVKNTILHELIKPTDQSKEARQLITYPSFPKLASANTIDEDYINKLTVWMNANTNVIVNAFKEDKSDKNIYTPLQPVDSQPMVFASQADLDSKKEYKKSNLIYLIEQNQNDLEKVKYYREELWRFENAVVKEPK